MKIGVVLTDSFQSGYVAKAAFLWRQLETLGLCPPVRIVQATNTPDMSPMVAWVDERVIASDLNPGYFAPPGVLHGHHSNLNAGVDALLDRGCDIICATCGDIAPVHPMLLTLEFIESGKPVGLAFAPWEAKSPKEARVIGSDAHINRFQDDVTFYTADGARDVFPITVQDVEPYWSEVSFYAHIEQRGLLDQCHIFEDMRHGWRLYWYEMHGFKSIGPDRPGVTRPEKRRM